MSIEATDSAEAIAALCNEKAGISASTGEGASVSKYQTNIEADSIALALTISNITVT